MSKQIKSGDLVTVTLNEFQLVSNTYVVARKLENESVLSHPLAPGCYLIKKDEELNVSLASMQSPLEKCLLFAKQNKEFLGYTQAEDLEALCIYFVFKKDLTPKQRNDLANICGKISSVKLGNNLTSAILAIKANKVLLDEYNHSLFNAVRRIFDDPLSVKNKGERYTVFNIAGFVLAQLSST